MGLVVFLFLLSFPYPALFGVAWVGFGALVALLLLDLVLLYGRRGAGRFGLESRRVCPERLSNGDENELFIHLDNLYTFPVSGYVIDELPEQFQLRDLRFPFQLKAGASRVVRYLLRPVRRGEYEFGAVNVFVRSPLALVSRRYRTDQGQRVPVYPSFLQMRKYELMAASPRLTEFGLKKIRRVGQNREFEQIKEYVIGDDYRTVNWKATARRGGLMVNTFQDERAQPVYSLIDKGRVMKMPFAGMTLLDYAINASLVISNIALRKDDKAGLITFHHRLATHVPASRRNQQLQQLMEALYHEKTSFKETNYEVLYQHLRRNVTQRSLLLLFTNFETLTGLQRQLPYLRLMARDHVLVVVFFENTELRDLIEQPSHDLTGIYVQTIAEKIAFEKRQVVRELSRYGIQSILTPPDQLTLKTVNKYLELKARGLV